MYSLMVTEANDTSQIFLGNVNEAMFEGDMYWTNLTDFDPSKYIGYMV